MLTLRRGCFGGWLATGVAPLTSSTPCRRMRLRLPRCRQLMKPAMTRFLATRAFHSKAAGKMSKNRRLRLSAPTVVATGHRRGCRTGVATGVVAPVQPRHHTPALRALKRSWSVRSEEWVASRDSPDPSAFCVVHHIMRHRIVMQLQGVWPGYFHLRNRRFGRRQGRRFHEWAGGFAASL